MTELLKGTLTLSDFIKLVSVIVLPIAIYIIGLEKRITLLEYKYNEIGQEIAEIKNKQNQIIDGQIRLIKEIERLQVTFELKKNE